MEYVDVAVGIIWRGGFFLAGQRGRGKVLEGYWEFPGGKLEAGEDALDALKRELSEELGIGVRTADFWMTAEHPYPESGFVARLHFFHVTAFTGEPCGREGQNLRWVTPAEARELGFLPADAALLDELVPLYP